MFRLFSKIPRGLDPVSSIFKLVGHVEPIFVLLCQFWALLFSFLSCSLAYLSLSLFSACWSCWTYLCAFMAIFGSLVLLSVLLSCLSFCFPFLSMLPLKVWHWWSRLKMQLATKRSIPQFCLFLTERFNFLIAAIEERDYCALSFWVFNIQSQYGFIEVSVQNC